MKALHPYFYGQTLIFFMCILSTWTTAVVAAPIPRVPQWYPLEIKAVSLYQSAISRESSDLQGALQTLRQARQESTAAMTNGGGANPVVLHNDSLIAQALITAQTHAAKAPQRVHLIADQNRSHHLTRLGSNHLAATIRGH